MQLINRTILSILSLIALVFSMPSQADLTIGIFSQQPTEVTKNQFRPLSELLTYKLGEKVRLVVANDIKSFWKDIAAARFDIVQFNQYHYALAHDQQGYQVFAVNEEAENHTTENAISISNNSGFKKVGFSESTSHTRVLPRIQPLWAAKKNLNPAKLKKITSSMTSLSKGSVVLRKAGVTGFSSAIDADFAKIKELALYTLSK